MVVSIEVDDGKALAEGLIKALTGGDTVTARYLYAEAFEFTPRFKLWLAANHRPRVRADDEAMWRRIVQIPFTNTVPEAERDPTLKHRFKTDPEIRAAILAWAVQGCLDWQQHGLDIPARVRDYTAEYRAENDPLAEWIADDCQLGTRALDLRTRPPHRIRTLVREGRQQANRRRPSMGQRTQSPRLHPKRRLAGHGWQGIALHDPMTPMTPKSENLSHARTQAEVYRNARHLGSYDPPNGPSSVVAACHAPAVRVGSESCRTRDWASDLRLGHAEGTRKPLQNHTATEVSPRLSHMRGRLGRSDIGAWLARLA